MGTNGPVRVVRDFWDAMSVGDFDGAFTRLSDGCTLTYVRDDNPRPGPIDKATQRAAVEANAARLSQPASVEVVAAIAEGGVVVAETRSTLVTADGTTVVNRALGWYEVDGGRIERMTLFTGRE
jgi:ketosteroid isomerase-like protein